MKLMSLMFSLSLLLIVSISRILGINSNNSIHPLLMAIAANFPLLDRLNDVMLSLAVIFFKEKMLLLSLISNIDSVVSL